MPDVWNIAGLVITVLSFLYAIYQGIKSSQLKRLVHSQTWDLHARANNATGAVQKAYERYKKEHNDNIKGVEMYPSIEQFQLSEMPNKHFFRLSVLLQLDIEHFPGGI